MGPDATRWEQLGAEAPELAAAGEQLLFQHGPGLAYLATVRAERLPRIHPVCPTLVGGGLYVSVGPSPKRRDLRDDGRFALHTFPCTDIDDEFMVAGSARACSDSAEALTVTDDLHRRGVNTGEGELIVELLLERALHSKYAGPKTWPPVYTWWTPGGGARPGPVKRGWDAD